MFVLMQTSDPNEFEAREEVLKARAYFGTCCMTCQVPQLWGVLALPGLLPLTHTLVPTCNLVPLSIGPYWFYHRIHLIHALLVFLPAEMDKDRWLDPYIQCRMRSSTATVLLRWWKEQCKRIHVRCCRMSQFCVHYVIFWER